MSTFDKIKDSGAVLVYIFAGYRWAKIWFKIWKTALDSEYTPHIELVFFILCFVLVVLLLLGAGIIYYLGTTKKYR